MLIQLIYCSVARRDFSPRNLSTLLRVARQNNARENITGMLLYAERSFFQVLEGEEQHVTALFDTIRKDPRHHNLTVIIQEPIPERSFGNWTMGYADITPEEVSSILGANSFLVDEQFSVEANRSRATKLLTAFKQGHWRARVTNQQVETEQAADLRGSDVMFAPARADQRLTSDTYSFAFQPIISARNRHVFSYEALLRGLNGESARHVLNNVAPADIGPLDEESRLLAINLAANLGLATHLNLNIIPSTAISSPETVPSILSSAAAHGIQPEQIVLEVLESEMIEDFDLFTGAIREHRDSGIRFAIDDFGAGYAGLNLLAEFQPHLIKLDMHLVRDIHAKGPRQAIVRGLLSTCRDLGIDVIAEGIETEEEFFWLRQEGIDLFQGYLLAKPAFEQLAAEFHLPEPFPV